MVVLGPHGAIIANAHLRIVFREEEALPASLGIWRPTATDLDAALVEVGLASPIAPLSVAEALAPLDPATASGTEIVRTKPVVRALLDARSAPAPTGGQQALVVAELASADRAPLLDPIVLTQINIKIRKGEVVGGKTTLGLCLTGLLAKEWKRWGALGRVCIPAPGKPFCRGHGEQ